MWQAKNKYLIDFVCNFQAKRWWAEKTLMIMFDVVLRGKSTK